MHNNVCTYKRVSKSFKDWYTTSCQKTSFLKAPIRKQCPYCGREVKVLRGYANN